jgi:nucleotide-binding universal stress UspA family protein
VYPFRNILFPTDFKPHTRAALKYAAAFARSGSGRVIIFSVQSGKVPAGLLESGALDYRDEQSWLSQLRRDFHDVLADPMFAGLDVKPAIVSGEPAPEIARAALDYGSDLVTIVTHRRKGITRALWGSTAEEIIAEAPCPVLTIRPPQHDFVESNGSECELRLNRIVLATNFRPSASAATHVATQLANQTGAELHAVHVIGDYFEQISAMFPEGGLSALKRMRSYANDRMAQLTRADRAETFTHIAEGRPYEEIVKLASERAADLIVIGTNVHASLFGGTPVLGSEIERVVRHAPCPVLCVPASKALTPLPAFVAQPV